MSPEGGATDATLRLFGWIGAVVVGLMALHVTLDITSRFLLNFPLPGTVEIVARYYMVAVIFLPLAYVQATRAHFRADLLGSVLPARVLDALERINDLGMTVLCGLLAWQGARAAIESTRSGEHVKTAWFLVPTWPSRWIVPIGLTAMAVVAAAQLFRGTWRGSARAGGPSVGEPL